MHRTPHNQMLLGPSQAGVYGYGTVPTIGYSERGEGRGYTPVDPFKASLTLGIRKLFGRTNDRTIDEVPVQFNGPAALLQGYPSRVPPQIHQNQRYVPAHDTYCEVDGMGGSRRSYASPALSSGIPQPPPDATNGVRQSDDTDTTEVFVPQGLLAAGICIQELCGANNPPHLSTPNNPPPQTGLLGAISVHERDGSSGLGASLTERERERQVSEEEQAGIACESFFVPRRRTTQTGLLGAITAYDQESKRGSGGSSSITIPVKLDTTRRIITWAIMYRLTFGHNSLPWSASHWGDANQRSIGLLPQTDSPGAVWKGDSPKTPSRWPKFISPFKGEEKLKVPKSSKKEKALDEGLAPSSEEPAAAEDAGVDPMEKTEAAAPVKPSYEDLVVRSAEAYKEEVESSMSTELGRRLLARNSDLYGPKPILQTASPSVNSYPTPPWYTEMGYGYPNVELTWFAIASSLFLDVIPRQVYLHLLLRFPALYFSRVTRIFQDANLGMGEIKRMALEAVELDQEEGLYKALVYQGVFPQECYADGGKASMSYTNLRNSWQGFIDSLMREWKTLNIVSVLLLSAILTILQIESAASNPLTRFSALISLVCAFMSLIYGCLYIIRFGTMRKTHKAAEWANESERTSTSIFWNVWVMLAMPAVWLGWSMVSYIVCIMSFVWQTGTTIQPRDYRSTDLEIFIPRVLISCILGLGVIYLILIGVTFRRYSDAMEQAWQWRIRGWLVEKAYAARGCVEQYEDMHAQERYAPAPAPEPKVTTKERSSPEAHPPQQNVEVSSAPAPPPVKPGTVSSTSLSPSSKERRTKSMVKGPRPMPTLPRPSRSLVVNNTSTRNRLSERVGEKDTMGSLSAKEVPPPGLFAALAWNTPAPPCSINRPAVEGDRGAEPSRARAVPFEAEASHPRELAGAEPLRHAGLTSPNASEIERMEKVLRFDLDALNLHTPQAPDGSPSPSNPFTAGAIPIPRGWLEVGLTKTPWKSFCTELASSWPSAADRGPRALAGMFDVIDRWNRRLKASNVAMVLVPSDEGGATVSAQTPGARRNQYSLYFTRTSDPPSGCQSGQ